MSEKIVDKVKKRIADLEQAIQRLDFVKRHLNQNSSEIKTQIHTSISRHLETLRNREVCLLGQVDTVLVGKEEVLQCQQARLNKALGVLHSSLSHATNCGDEDIAARHLVQALEELNTAELKAEETPYIAFRADQVALRESILSYGRVDAKGMPLQSAFADEDNPSASLPRHVEEYEDSEHHLFYKALQEVKTNSGSIHVSIPKLSSRVEDWLQRPMLQLNTSTMDMKSPASDAVGTPMSQTTCAIQNWLSEIKHNPDLEDDDDFEIVDHSGSSQRESPVDEEVKGLTSLDAEVLDMFSHIPRDRRLWLLKGGSTRGSSTTEEDLRAFFQHIPQDTNMWLLTARKQLESLDELKRGRWFDHIPTETATWLKRAHDKRAGGSQQAAVPDMFSHIPQDKSVWLKKKVASADVQELEVAEAKNRQMMETEDRDRFSSAFTSVSTPAPLQSLPDLMEEYLAGSPSTLESWLLYREGPAASSGRGSEEPETELSSLPGVQRYLSSSFNSSTWLVTPEEREADSQPSTSSPSQFFSHVSSNPSDWLLSGQQKMRNTNPTRAIDLQQAAKQNLSQWLRSGSLSVTEVSSGHSSPLDSLLQSFTSLSTSDWLMQGRRRKDSGDTESTRSWRVLPEPPQSSLSLQAVATSGRQIPPLNLASWVFQNAQ